MKGEGQAWKIVLSWERESKGQQTTIYSPDLVSPSLNKDLYPFRMCTVVVSSLFISFVTVFYYQKKKTFKEYNNLPSLSRPQDSEVVQKQAIKVTGKSVAEPADKQIGPLLLNFLLCI